MVSHPENEDVEFRPQEECSEDRLVVSSQPERQVDVKVISALIGVPSRDARERTTPAIERQDCALDQYGHGEGGCPAKFTPGTGYRYCENASYEEDPDGSVKHLTVMSANGPRSLTGMENAF